MSRNDFDGSGFTVYLILCSLIVVGGFVGMTSLIFVLSFGKVPDDMSDSAASYFECYLTGQPSHDVYRAHLSNLSASPSSKLNVISMAVKPDYLKTALRPCRPRSHCQRRAYRAYVTYEFEGVRAQKTIPMKWKGSGYYWHIE